jgi:hypothetical protein
MSRDNKDMATSPLSPSKIDISKNNGNPTRFGSNKTLNNLNWTSAITANNFKGLKISTGAISPNLK